MKLSSIRLETILATLKYGMAILAVGLIKGKKENIWIISERPNQARDNGLIFFEFMRTKHPDKWVFYLIDKKANDYKKIAKYGNVIQFNSWKHYFYYCLAKIHISAHVNGCCPDGAIGISRRTKNILNFKDVFLPHGVSYGISKFCLKKYARIDLYVCSGKAEYENVLANYGYSEQEVAYTGFPRLDKWHNITVNSKQIVLMPTWRSYLAEDKNTVFENTVYFKTYQSLLQNKELETYLVNNDLKLVFYLHNEMRKYVDYFRVDCPNIEVVYKDDTYDIQELLKSSVMLITDYSSVHFDFAYMNKPIIYYQFDREEFFGLQYQKSLFDVEKDGFGPVVTNVEDLIREIMVAYNNDFMMSEEYYARMRKFYQLYDCNNCERVYEEIKRWNFERKIDNSFDES